MKLLPKRFSLKAAMIAVACLALALWLLPDVWDYSKELWHPASGFDIGLSDNELHGWPEGEPWGNYPGLDHGSCLRIKTGQASGFIIWTDFRWSPASRGGHLYGFLAKPQDEEGRESIHWRWTTDGGQAGTLVINDEAYPVEKGSLFLISTRDAKVRVKQLDRNELSLLTMPSYRLVRRLQTLARHDPGIDEFFAGPPSGMQP